MKKKRLDFGSRENIAIVYDYGNWFMFPKFFLYAMKEPEAILLAYLINHSQNIRADEKNDGRFYCTSKRISKDLIINVARQTRLFTVLKKKKFIRCSMEGIPPTRWIIINYFAIQDAINEGYNRWMDELEKDPD